MLQGAKLSLNALQDLVINIKVVMVSLFFLFTIGIGVILTCMHVGSGTITTPTFTKLILQKLRELS